MKIISVQLKKYHGDIHISIFFSISQYITVYHTISDYINSILQISTFCIGTTPSEFRTWTAAPCGASIGSPHGGRPVNPLREGLRGFQLMKKPGGTWKRTFVFFFFGNTADSYQFKLLSFIMFYHVISFFQLCQVCD